MEHQGQKDAEATVASGACVGSVESVANWPELPEWLEWPDELQWPEGSEWLDEQVMFWTPLQERKGKDFYTTANFEKIFVVYCYHVGVGVVVHRPNTFSFRTLTLVKVNGNL